MLLTTNYILHSIPEKTREMADMRTFYTSAVMLRNGVKENLYNIPTIALWQKAIFHDVSHFNINPFWNPPFVAILFFPLSFISFNNAYIIFAFLNTCIILACVYIILHELYPEKQYIKALFPLIFSFFYFPILLTICQGQLSFFLLGGIVFSWYAFKHKSFFVAGIALSLLLIKPYMILIPLILLFWKKQWRTLQGVFLSTGFLIVISIFTVGWSGLYKYGELLFNGLFAAENYSLFPQTEPTLRGLLQLIAHSNSLYVIIIPFLIGIVCIGLLFTLTWKGSFDTTNSRFDMQWGILVIMIILTSIHTNYYELTLLLLPYIILLKYSNKNRFLYIGGIILDAITFAFYPQASLITSLIILVLGMLYVKQYSL